MIEVRHCVCRVELSGRRTASMRSCEGSKGFPTWINGPPSQPCCWRRTFARYRQNLGVVTERVAGSRRWIRKSRVKTTMSRLVNCQLYVRLQEAGRTVEDRESSVILAID